MSKPEDISQEAWDASSARALEVAATALRNLEQDDFAIEVRAIRVGIARAFMAAKAEEREACEQIVLGYPPEGFNAALYERTERHDEHDPFWKFEGDTGNWAALMGEVLKPYAAAIRKRGEG